MCRYPLHVPGWRFCRVADAAGGNAQGILSSAQDHNSAGRGAHNSQRFISLLRSTAEKSRMID